MSGGMLRWSTSARGLHQRLLRVSVQNINMGINDIKYKHTEGGTFVFAVAGASCIEKRCCPATMSCLQEPTECQTTFEGVRPLFF